MHKSTLVLRGYTEHKRQETTSRATSARGDDEFVGEYDGVADDDRRWTRLNKMKRRVGKNPAWKKNPLHEGKWIRGVSCPSSVQTAGWG